MSEEDRMAPSSQREKFEAISEDPMHDLEGLDVAGPQRVKGHSR